MIIGPAQPSDAGEILTVQHAAYVTEAQLYDDPHIVTLDESSTPAARPAVMIASDHTAWPRVGRCYAVRGDHGVTRRP